MSTRTFTSHPPASVSGRVAAVLLIVVAGFQVALAAGAPWGEATQGGFTPGVLPDASRVGCAVSGILYLVLAGVVGTRWVGVALRRRLLYAAAALMVLGAFMNIASPSFVERIIWTPVTVTLVMALWSAARHPAISVAPRGHGRQEAPAAA